MEHLIHQRLATCVIVLILVLALPIQKMTRAQSGSGYELTWSSIDGGGYMRSASTGGGYSLGGTMGQPDAGTMSGGGYTLVGGFWGGATTQYRIYLPVVLRSS